MSSKVEWSTADQPPLLVDPGFSDGHGVQVARGNLGVWMGAGGNSDGAIMEGKPSEIIAWATRLISLVLQASPEMLGEPEADPDCEVCEGSGVVRIEDGKGHGAETECWECLP